MKFDISKVKLPQTKEERRRLLINAGILLENGDYNPELFPEAYAEDKRLTEEKNAHKE